MATIKDIAKLTNLSPATVSRVLNNDKYLSVTLETREKIKKAAADLGYHQRKRTVHQEFTIGIIQWVSLFQEIDDSYYLTIRQGLEEFCRKNEIPVVRVFKNDLNYLEKLKAVDAIGAIGKFSDDDINEFQKITKNLILIDMINDRPDLSYIVPDFVAATTQIMDYLVKLGYQKIGYIGGKEYIGRHVYPDQRKSTFIDYCRKNDLEYQKWFVEEKFTVESGYQMASHLLSQEELPQALVCASDNLAMGALRCLVEKGYQVPRDISLVSFNDIKMASYSNPPLSTVHLPSFDMGVIGGNILYNCFYQNNLQTPLKIKVPGTFLTRDSVDENKFK